MKKEEFFPLGASHAPYTRAEGVPRSEWELDFIRMKEHSLNTVSVFAAWDRIEKRKGHYDFSDLDHAFALAEKHGMKLSVAIGVHLGFSKHTPRWFMREFKGYELIARTGEKCMEGNYVQPCFEDPSYNKAAERYIRALVRRYRKSPALLQWRVWGESNISSYCICERHAILFREYLKKKYKRISVLNEHWGWEGPGHYRSFAEVTIPCERNKAAANSYTEMEDFYDFLDESMSSTIARAESWVKKEDPHTKTIGEYFGMARDNHAGDGQNMSKLSAIHDSVGLSLFSNLPSLWALRMDAVSSLAKYNGNEAWTIELQGGPAAFSWQFFNIPSWKKIAMRMWSCVAHESRGIYFWTWRPRLTEFESGEYGMTRLDGSVTSKTKALSEEFALLQKYASLFRSVKRRVRCAVLFSRPAETLAALSKIDWGDRSICKGSVTDCHKILWRHNIPADLLPLEHLDHLCDYDYIFLPCLFAVSREVADRLKEYVEQGGCLIADAMLGIKDHQGRCGSVIPSQGLDEVFSFTEDEKFDPSDSTLIGKGSITLHAPRVVQTLLVKDPHAEILAEFDAKPAMIRSSFGKGRTLYSGSMLFNCEAWEEHAGNESFLMSLLAEMGLQSEITFVPHTANVECLLLDTAEEDQLLVMILNHNDTAVSGKVRILFKVKTLQDLRKETLLPVTEEGECSVFEIEAEKWQALFFLAEKA